MDLHPTFDRNLTETEELCDPHLQEHNDIKKILSDILNEIDCIRNCKTVQDFLDTDTRLYTYREKLIDYFEDTD